MSLLTSRVRTLGLPYRLAVIGVVLLFCAAIFFALVQQTDAQRFSYRGMYINSARGGDTTYYIITLAYPTPNPLGSLRMEFCDNPIPSLPCNVPAGLDVSSGTLSAQSGSNAGFTVSSQTQNEIILSRAPQMPAGGNTSYRFDNMVNPAGDTQDFYVRITSHGSTDGTGPIIDYGSVTATTTPEIGIYTQVPPILIFCVGAQINDDECVDVEGNYVDFGELDPGQTFYITSQMQARTNAQYGYSISVVGRTMTSGVKVIPGLSVPTQSFPGVSQFGFNLTENTQPTFGSDPVGAGTNANVNPGYQVPNHFVFNSGDTLVTSSEVTRMRKFTSSYIVNVSEEQPPGVYSTTLTYICIAGF
jgi:hypothetical protein